MLKSKTKKDASPGGSQTQTGKVSVLSNHPKKSLNEAQSNMCSITEMLLRLQTEMNHTEVEWLQLCSIVRSQQPNPPEDTKEDKKLFKDADEINATSLADLELFPKEADNTYNSDLE